MNSRCLKYYYAKKLCPSRLAFQLLLITLLLSALLLHFIFFCFCYVYGVAISPAGSAKSAEPFACAIPDAALRRWRKTEFLIVMGIPSEDSPARRRRRNLQRKTCWTFDGVARRDNHYAGSMIVLYALARSTENSFHYSAEHREEAEKWHDILELPLSEGKKSTNKTIGGNGFWGIEAEIGMSRKTYYWFYLANKLFPLASYITKGDDDIFLRVPVYLETLRILPKRGLYWGFGHPMNDRKGTANSTKNFFVFGMCITLSVDLVERFLKYTPIRDIVHKPYSEASKGEFLSLLMDNEDGMLGAALYNSAYEKIVYALDRACHLHNIHTGFPIGQVTLDSMVIHHLKEEEYEIFMKMFANIKGPFAPQIYRQKNIIKFACRPGLHTLYPPR